MNFLTAIPVIRIFDESKMKEFYIDYLEFKVDWEYRHAPNLPNYLQLSKGDCNLHLSEHHSDCCPGASIRIQCTSLDKYHNILKAKQYNNANPSIVNQPWGKKELIVTDPFGNRLTFFDEGE